MGDAPTTTSTPDARDAPADTPATWDASIEPDAQRAIAVSGPPAVPATSATPPFSPPPAASGAQQQAAVVPLKPSMSPAALAEHERQAASVAAAAAVQPEPLSGSVHEDRVAAVGRAAPGYAQFQDPDDPSAVRAAQRGAADPQEAPAWRQEGSSDALAVLSAIAGSFSGAARFVDLQAEAAAAGGGEEGSGDGEGVAGGLHSGAGRGEGGPTTSGDGGGVLEGGGTRSKRRNVLNELHSEAQALEAAIRRMQVCRAVLCCALPCWAAPGGAPLCHAVVCSTPLSCCLEEHKAGSVSRRPCWVHSAGGHCTCMHPRHHQL